MTIVSERGLGGLSIPKEKVEHLRESIKFYICIHFTVHAQFLRCFWIFVIPHGLEHARLLCPSHFPMENTGWGLPFPSQGIFLAQGSMPHLCIGRQILYHWATGEALIHLATSSSIQHGLGPRGSTSCGSSFVLPAPERTILGCWSVLPHERFLAVCRVPACPPLPSPDRHTPLHRREDSWFSL